MFHLKSLCTATNISKIISSHRLTQFRSFADDPFTKCPQFSSAITLSNIYPRSNLDVSSNVEIPTSENRFNGYIPMEDISIKVARSGKPGGQHVNKINSKVCISLHLSSANWIPLRTKEKLMTIHRNNITKDGHWMIRSEKTREQKLNLADCLDKMRCYITEADKPIPEVSEESLERKRLQAEKASERRLRDKRHRSMLKMAKMDF